MPRGRSNNFYEVSAIDAYIEKMKRLAAGFGKRIVANFKHGQLDRKDVNAWLKFQNIINMFRVCVGFNRGSLFYSDDANHFASMTFDSGRPNYDALTTVSSLIPIYYSQQKSFFNVDIALDVKVMRDSYKIKPDASASAALINLLHSRTSLDCNGSVMLANYLSLLDLLQLVYGSDDGKIKFDLLFDAKYGDNHDLNRLRIGNMGNCQFPGSRTDFSSLSYFTQANGSITTDDLINDPARYIGSRFCIKGHEDYLNKHPTGASASWNVIFIGLNKASEPMFLAARRNGENYFLSYSELLALLATNFNKTPSFTNREYLDNTCKADELTGLLDNSISFNIDRIMHLLSNPFTIEKELKEYCDNYYSIWFLNFSNLQAVADNQVIMLPTFNQECVKETKDDCEFYKNSHRLFKLERFKLVTKDDIQLGENDVFTRMAP